MKRFVLALFAAVCLAAAPAVIAEVPVGDNISHVAEDGSYRDNVRRVWVDACGKEHSLCATEVCAPEIKCLEPEVCKSDTIISLSCPTSTLTQADINSIATTTVSMIQFTEVDDTPKFLKKFAVSAVIGGNEFRGIQARYKFLGIRAGRMDLSDFISVPGNSLPVSTSDRAVCHNGKTIYPATPGAINGHLNHGDTLGECDSSDPEQTTDLGFRRIDNTAETLEAFIYIDSFFKNDQPFGLYVGGGVVRIEEEHVLFTNGRLRSIDNRYIFRATATAGVDYTFPCRLVLGAGYHTEAGGLVSAGYGITW